MGANLCPKPGFYFFEHAKLFPDCKVTVEHSFGGGLYCEVHGCVALSPLVVERIEEHMRSIIDRDEPIER